MNITMDNKTINIMNETMKKVGSIATYDMSDMEDVLMAGMLTEEEDANIGLQERMRISRLLRKTVLNEYIQIINYSEVLADEYIISGLTEKNESILKNEIKNSIRRILIQETNQVNRIIIRKIQEEMENRPITMDERISLVDELYMDILSKYRCNNSTSKMINESVDKLVRILKMNISNDESTLIVILRVNSIGF